MATTSTLGLAWSALVAAINVGELAGKSFYAWPAAQAATLVEGAWVHEVKEWTTEIPNAKAGRKQRQEDYTLDLVVWATAPAAGAEGQKTAIDRVLALVAVVENALADDPQLGQAAIQYLEITDRDGPTLFPWNKGWGAQVVLSVEGHARLT